MSCAWVDGQYRISGGLRTAAEAVRAKQADVASL